MTHILVIDDDPITTTFIGSIVDSDWTVLSATDGVSGLAILRNHPSIDLVILDIHMPGMDGYRTAAQIRRISMQVRIVPYTVMDPVREDPNLEAYMQELGCAPVLRKGMSPESLAHQLHVALATPPQVHQSAILIQLQRELSEREREIRSHQLYHHILLYTTSPVAQQGIKTLLEATESDLAVQIVASAQQLQSCAGEDYPHMLVTMASDYHTILESITQGCALVPIILADTVPDATAIVTHLAMQQCPVCFGVIVANAAVVTKLAQAIAMVREGTCYIDPDSQQTDPDRDQVMRQQLQQYFGLETISTDELTLIQMQMNHASTHDIAQHLGTSTSNVYQLRSRLVKRAGVRHMADVLQRLTLGNKCAC